MLEKENFFQYIVKLNKSSYIKRFKALFISQNVCIKIKLLHETRKPVLDYSA